jgi:hypothetical protein
MKCPESISFVIPTDGSARSFLRPRNEMWERSGAGYRRAKLRLASYSQPVPHSVKFLHPAPQGKPQQPDKKHFCEPYRACNFLLLPRISYN